MTNTILLNFKKLHTERLILRKPQVSDATAHLKILQNPSVTKYLYVDEDSLNLESQTKYIRDQLKRMEKSSPDLIWFVEHQNDLIGFIRLSAGTKMNPFKGDLGYRLAENEWGKGFMQEALKAVIKYAFSIESPLTALQITVFSENTASIKLAKKLGFTEEGCIRESIYKNNKFYDETIFTRLKKD